MSATEHLVECQGQIQDDFSEGLTASLSKQCRPRSDATFCGIRSKSTLFATHRAIVHVHVFMGSKMDLLKRRIRQREMGFQIYQKLKK